MAFLIHSIDDGHIPAMEYLPCGAITPVVGLALTQTGGNLAVASGMPTYISMCQRETACTAGDCIPVIRVSPDIVFETTFSAAASSIKAGNKLTIKDGLQVTATTSNGVAEVISMDGTAVGDKVRIRFSA